MCFRIHFQNKPSKKLLKLLRILVVCNTYKKDLIFLQQTCLLWPVALFSTEEFHVFPGVPSLPHICMDKRRKKAVSKWGRRCLAVIPEVCERPHRIHPIRAPLVCVYFLSGCYGDSNMVTADRYSCPPGTPHAANWTWSRGKPQPAQATVCWRQFEWSFSP